MSEHDPRDLVVIALSGVQRYITESRTTADLRAASQIVAHLAAEAVDHLDRHHDAKMVFPAPVQQSEQSGKRHKRGTEDGMPNRVVALLPEGTGPTAAKHTAKHLDTVWKKWMQEVFDRCMPQVPGWPVVQWVSVPAGPGSYAQAWKSAQRSLAQRKNVRDFTQPREESRELCSLSPRWRSIAPPELAPKHQRAELLAPANWVRRLWHKTKTGQASGFASTNAIASSPYRNEVLRLWREDSDIPALVELLKESACKLGKDPVQERPLEWLANVPGSDEAKWLRSKGSRWVFPESWHIEVLAREFSRKADDPELISAVHNGWESARELIKTMGRHGIEPPSPHLAVLVQDLDSMGRFLSGHKKAQSGQELPVSAPDHQKISQSLSTVATEQREDLKNVGGTVVYAGGDDLLALVPAHYALEAARACHDTVHERLPTASTGLLFFHHDSSLRRALHRAQELLEEAKRYPGKHALGVGMVRHSGAHADCVLPWAGEIDPVTALRVFTPSGIESRVRLSPGLLGDLMAERVHLDGGDEQERKLYRNVLPDEAATKELRRLVLRHSHVSAEEDAPPLSTKEEWDLRTEFADKAAIALRHMAPRQRLVDENAVRVALFLRQEAS